MNREKVVCARIAIVRHIEREIELRLAAFSAADDVCLISSERKRRHFRRVERNRRYRIVIIKRSDHFCFLFRFLKSRIKTEARLTSVRSVD